jgi:hypothetical protein
LIYALEDEYGASMRVLTPVMGAKSQSGMSPEIVGRFNNTANNPALLDAVGLWLVMVNIPSLPSLPPSSTLLKTLWSV